MKYAIILFFLFSIDTITFGMMSDTLSKKRIRFGVGIGLNSNMPSEEKFKYYNDPKAWDGVIQDYDVAAKWAYSPNIEISAQKDVFLKNSLKLNLSINYLMWLVTEKYNFTGTDKYPNGLIIKKTGNISNQIISNYLGIKTSIIFNKIGFFINSGFHDYIYYKSQSEVYEDYLNFNKDQVKSNSKEEHFNSNYQFRLGLSPGLELHYKLRNLNFKSQLFTLFQFNKKEAFTYKDSFFYKKNYVIFLSTTLII